MRSSTLCLVVLAATGLASAAEPPSEEPLPGLKLELVVPKDTYELGKPIELTMRYTYSGTRKLAIEHVNHGELVAAFGQGADRRGRVGCQQVGRQHPHAMRQTARVVAAGRGRQAGTTGGFLPRKELGEAGGVRAASLGRKHLTQARAEGRPGQDVVAGQCHPRQAGQHSPRRLEFGRPTGGHGTAGVQPQVHDQRLLRFAHLDEQVIRSGVDVPIDLPEIVTRAVPSVIRELD